MLTAISLESLFTNNVTIAMYLWIVVAKHFLYMDNCNITLVGKVNVTVDRFLFAFTFRMPVATNIDCFLNISHRTQSTSVFKSDPSFLSVDREHNPFVCNNPKPYSAWRRMYNNVRRGCVWKIRIIIGIISMCALLNTILHTGWLFYIFVYV